MRKFLSGMMILLASCSAASANGASNTFSAIDETAPVVLVQGVSETTRSNDRPARPQRYMCVVQAQGTANSSRPNVCRADAGRVGGRCRCNGVIGNGTLRLAN